MGNSRTARDRAQAFDIESRMEYSLASWDMSGSRVRKPVSPAATVDEFLQALRAAATPGFAQPGS
jgi:hypothetical protein